MITRREFLKLAGSSLGSLALPYGLVQKIAFATSAARAPLTPIYHVKTEKPEFYITIDDGWFPASLHEMLKTLEKASVQATFFLVGSAAIVAEKEQPGILRLLLRNGNQLGYHTMTHRRASKLALNGLDWFLSDYDQWRKTIQKLVNNVKLEAGIKNYARAPGGYFSPNFIRLCAKRNLLPIAWNHVVDNTGKAKPLLRRGDILLIHATPADSLLLKTYLASLNEIAEKGIAPELLFMESNPPGS
jgi:peptidoglycan/xylan/chitin deacetylase (PgdA/CDA1 family)